MYALILSAHGVVSFHYVLPKLAIFTNFPKFYQLSANIMCLYISPYMCLYVYINQYCHLLAFNELLTYKIWVYCRVFPGGICLS